MIILAGAVFISIGNSNIIDKANQAVDSTNKQQESYQETLNELVPKSLVSQITASNYGDKVNYSANGINDWRVFYNDGKNVYIITTDYLPSIKIPSNVALRNTGTEFSTSFAYNSLDFPEAAIINNEQAGKYKIEEYGQFVNTNYNMRSCALLLNTEKWADFTNEFAVDAIGTPTIGMWIASWNAKYPEDKILYKPNTETNAIGYMVGLSEDNMVKVIPLEEMQEKAGYKVEESNNLYYPHKETITDSYNVACKGYWIASPSANGEKYIIRINFDGRVYYAHSGDVSRYAIRPVVCLKEEVGATFSNGMWNLKISDEKK
ncbi:MAG: hypothetical protein IKL68_06335 [Clostridia bacterium]|nr:hypothetical protein [Clostridia bacterium]